MNSEGIIQSPSIMISSKKKKSKKLKKANKTYSNPSFAILSLIFLTKRIFLNLPCKTFDFNGNNNSINLPTEMIQIYPREKEILPKEPLSIKQYDQIKKTFFQYKDKIALGSLIKLLIEWEGKESNPLEKNKIQKIVIQILEYNKPVFQWSSLGKIYKQYKDSISNIQNEEYHNFNKILNSLGFSNHSVIPLEDIHYQLIDDDISWKQINYKYIYLTLAMKENLKSLFYKYKIQEEEIDPDLTPSECYVCCNKFENKNIPVLSHHNNQWKFSWHKRKMDIVCINQYLKDPTKITVNAQNNSALTLQSYSSELLNNENPVFVHEFDNLSSLKNILVYIFYYTNLINDNSVLLIGKINEKFILILGSI
jgi:hypothetical protein